MMDYKAMALEEYNSAETTAHHGGAYGRPFWNANATQFTYVPAFGFPVSPMAKEYLFTATDCEGKKHSFTDKRPTALLTPIWSEIPTGMVTLTVEALDAEGKALFLTGARTFYKCAPFAGREAYGLPAQSYEDCAKKGLRYVLHQPFIRYFLEHGVPDPSYNYYIYPSKTIGAIVNALVNLAELDKESAEEALLLARKAADYLLSIRFKAPYAAEGLPPTYYTAFRPEGVGNNYAATPNLGKIMMIYPATAGAAYLALAKATKEEKYRKAALTIADYYLRTQLPEGSWPLMIDAESGNKTTENLCIPDVIMAFLAKVYDATKDVRYKDAADRSLSYIEEKCLKTYNWEGQFEDVQPTANYQNLTHFNAKNYLEYITEHRERTPEMLDTALDLCRFIEDQFVVWGKHAPHATNNTGEWLYPAGLEQYQWYHPINGSTTSAMRTFLCAHKLTKNPLFLEKARALADTVAKNQNEKSGAIPTYFRSADCAEKLEDFWLNCHTGAANDMMRIALYEKNLEKENA
jgi:hypothetical protein